MKFRKLVSYLLLINVIISVLFVSGCEKQDNTKVFMYKLDSGNLLFEPAAESYSQYIETNKKVKTANSDISLVAEDIVSAYSQEYFIELENETYAFIDRNSKWVEWDVEIPETAFYKFSVKYRTTKEESSENILVDVQVDGQNKYKEMKDFTLYRRWVDQNPSEGFQKDDSGNDVRPVKFEEVTDLSSVFYDEKGYYPDGYGIVLEKGTHKIRMSSVSNGLLIKSFDMLAEKKQSTYKKYIDSLDKKSGKATDEIVIEAEHPAYTNSASIYAVNDSTSAATTPNSYKNILLNAFGDVNWKNNGENVTWEFDAKESGYYYIALRARQDYSEGMNAYRSLYIDGEIPFKEMNTIKFPYDFDWKTIVVGEDKPYYVWLDKGKHTISLEVDTTVISDILIDLDELINDLNAIYRKIIIITGKTVDIYQDYDLDVKIPKLIDSFKDCCNRMRLISNKVSKSNNTIGSIASVLDETALLLDTFIEHSYQISGKLASYKTNVDDISTLLTNMSYQSLLLDKIIIVPKDNQKPDNDVSFLKKVKFSFLKFLDSYSSVQKDSKKGKKIKVWVNTGRDQAQIIKQMISNSYKNDKVQIDLNIVDTGGTLIQAALANRGPDVALSVPTTTPVNLAMREGLVDLSDKIDSIYGDFHESAWTQLKYKEGIYGIPETQVFQMVFIRDDILKEIGLSGAPETWDEFYKYMDVIQNNNLMIGMLETNGANVAVSGGISTFSNMYFQNGGTFFDDNFSKTTFDSVLAIDTMNKVVELYSRYGLDKSYNFFNRFRSGELVMSIELYSSYNQLVAAAPEINGLWSMHPIPGTKKGDGSIDISQSSSGTASIILKAAKEHNVVDEASDFLLWWCGEDAQSEFAERLEGIMGIAARYTPANLKAFESIKWSEKESETIQKQWKHIYNVREIPGNYYIERSLTSAIRNTISGKNSIRYNMMKYTNDINLEITRKRREFGLE